MSEEFSAYVAGQRAALETQAKSAPADLDGELSREAREGLKEEQAAAADAQARRDILDLLYLIESWYRDVLVFGATGDISLVLNRDRIGRVRAAGGEGLAEKLAAVDKARLYLERFITEDRVFRDLFFALAS